MLNFYNRAERAVVFLKNPLAIKILLALYPSHKDNIISISEKLSIESSLVQKMFTDLDSAGLIKDNPTSGNKVLTEEGKLFLEQTSTLFPDLKQFLEEQRQQKTLIV